MTLISRYNPERVTLRAGTYPIPVTELAGDTGVLYFYFGSQVSMRRGYPISIQDGGAATFQGINSANFLQSGDLFFAAQNREQEVVLWVGGPTTLRRHDLAEDHSVITSPSYQTPVSNFRFGNATPSKIKIDGSILYCIYGNGNDAKAFDFSGEALDAGQPLPRLENMDFSMGEDTLLDFDVKTVFGNRNILFAARESGGDTVINWNGSEILSSPFGTSFQVDIGDGAVNVFGQGDKSLTVAIDSTYPAEPRIVLGSARLQVTGLTTSYNGVVAIRTDGMTIGSATAIQYNAFPERLGEGPKAGQLALAQFSRPGLVERGNFPLTSGDKVYAQMTGQSVARLTEADGQAFREVREITVELTLQNVLPEFLLNRDWYFRNNGFIYQMVELLSQGEDVVASFKVSS